MLAALNRPARSAALLRAGGWRSPPAAACPAAAGTARRRAAAVHAAPLSRRRALPGAPPLSVIRIATMPAASRSRSSTEQVAALTTAATAEAEQPAKKRKVPATKRPPVTTPKKTRKKKAEGPPSPAPGSLEPPPGWRSQYEIVKELRAILDAPVDEFGSEALPERHVAPAVFRYQVLVALMLSSQTRDQVVGAAMRKLQAHGLTIENVLATDDEVLRAMLFGVGFYNNKTKYIKQTSQLLLDLHEGDVPATAKELCALPGIGPKMAFIILNVAHNVVTGIGIDTHMHRIMNQLRWMKTKTPEQTRTNLESWLPTEEWGVVNILFVGFGQQIQTEPTKLLGSQPFN